MNKFLVAFYETADDFQNLSAAVKKWGIHEAPFHAGQTHFYHYPHRKLVIYCVVSNTSAFDHYECIDLDERGGIVFDGAPYFHGFQSGKNWAKQIKEHLLGKLPYEALTTTLGDFSVCVIGPDSVYALSDFAGFNPIFYTRSGGITAISNRQRLLQRVTRPYGKLDLDPSAGAWIPGYANIFGEDSIYRGVKLVMPGRVALHANGRFRVAGMKRYYETGSRDEDFTTSQVRDMVDNLYNQADAAASLPFSTMKADLTGGMDSRAVLALVMGSKLKGKIQTFVTNGTSENGDIQVAKMIHRDIGVPHATHISPPPQEQPAASLWALVRRGVAGGDAAIIGNAGVTGQPKASYVSASGSGGEIIRPHVATRRNVTLQTLQEAKDLYEHYQVRTDPLFILRPEIRAARRADIHRMVNIYNSMGLPFDDMHYVFYSEHRCPWWAGYTNANTMDRKRLPLMVNFLAAQSMFSVSPHQKKIDRLHFEVVRRFSKTLLATPFLDKQWHGDLAKQEPGLDFIKPAFKAAPGAGGVHWTTSLAKQDWNSVFDMILSKKDSFVFDFADRRTIEMRRAEREKWITNQASILALISLVSFRVLEDEDYQPLRQGSEPPGGVVHTEKVFSLTPA